MGMHIGLIVGHRATTGDGQFAVRDDGQDVTQVVGAFVALAATGEVALFVGALAAV